ncbi:MAG TPA: metalloregulator ArsR/SmtB family transcription factor [Ktedonobacterales bacterium]|nr:metalloregulator ArsR/SmtB family transcription factor [Ktedonobacterales bacterium]
MALYYTTAKGAANILTPINEYGIIPDMSTHPSSQLTPSEARCSPATPLATPPDMPAETAERLADVLKALAEPTRLRMLALLAHHGEPLCVCDCTAPFAQHQPTISHHLRVLREAGLVDCEKRGVWAYYWATEAGRACLALVTSLI